MPVSQVRLTNVVVVRLKKKGKRFELACYPNKVLNWRNQIEKDIDEVIQTPSIFSSVSKGILAKKKDLEDCFNTTNEQEIMFDILSKGTVQVNEKERKIQLSSLFRDISTIVSSQCINTTTNLPYTVEMIETLMKEIHFNVNPNKNAKQQSLEVIRLLSSTLPLRRAHMRLKLSYPSNHNLRSNLSNYISQIEYESKGQIYEMVILIDPGYYRTVTELINKTTKGRGRVDVLDTPEMMESEMKELTLEDTTI